MCLILGFGRSRREENHVGGVDDVLSLDDHLDRDGILQIVVDCRCDGCRQLYVPPLLEPVRA